MAVSKVDAANQIENQLPQANIAGNVNFRNIIINGDMSIAQRGTSATGLGNGDAGYHTIDRWRFNVSGSPTFEFTQSQSTDVPSGQGFAKSLKMDCTTADASPAAGDSLAIVQRVEGQNLQYLKFGTSNAESLTLSFWVKSNKTGTYVASLMINDASPVLWYSTQYTISASNTWEKKTITYPGNTAQAFDNDNNSSLRIFFWLGAGSDRSGGSDYTAWTPEPGSAPFDLCPGQVNLADNTANEWYITGVQLEAGTTVSDFEFLPHDVNLQRCQRYFWKTYDIDDAPGTVNVGSRLGRFVDGTHNYASLQVPHVNLRASPTKTIYNPSTGATGQVITDGNVAKNATTENIDHHGGGWIYANNQSIGTSASIQAHLTLDAELN